MRDEPKIFLSYARQSLQRAGDQGDSVSVADQFRSMEEYATRLGGRIIARHSDVDISGGVESRAGLDQLLADVKTIKPDAVLIRDISRLARDTRIFLTLVDTLQRSGVQLMSATENLEDRTLTTVMAAFAERERLVLAGRVAGGVREHARRGRHFGHPPYGYRRVDGSLVIVESEAAIVRDFYRRWLAGESGPMIADRMNTDPLAPPAPGGGFWRREVIMRMLTHRAYCGDIAIKAKRDIAGRQWPAVLTLDAHPAIIERADWEAAQRLMRQQRTIVREARLSPIDGALVCAHCGRRLYVFRHERCDRPHKPPVERVMVRCSSYAKALHDGRMAPRCPGHVGSRVLHRVEPIARDAIHDLIARIVSADDLRARAEAMSAARHDDGETERALARIADLDRRRSRLLDAYESGALDLMTWTGRDKAIATDLAAAQAILDAQPAALDIDWLLAVRAHLADLPREGGLDYRAVIVELGITLTVDLDALTAVATPSDDLAPLFHSGVLARP